MHLWAHLQGGEAMGRCPFRATRPGGCRSGDHIHEAVTASPRTRPKRSPKGHGLLPHQQRTDALRPVSEPRSLCRFGSGRSRLQDYHRATTEAVGNALDSRPRQRNYRPSLFPAQWPLGRILGTTRRWLISARFFTYKFGAHPLPGPPLPPVTPRRTLGISYGSPGDSSVTTPAQFVPASQFARSARSEEVVAKHKKYLWPSVTNYFQQPLVVDRGEMQHLWDLEGNKYLDFFGGILTVSVGHCNPKISSKVNAQVNRLQHTSTLYPNEHIVALAEKIAQITPGNLQQSFFTNSGTEANEAAILLARMATGSYDVVALRHAYSGGSAIAKAITAHAPYRKGGVISVGISHAVNPYCYRCPLHLKYPDCEVACADDVENLIQTGTSGNIAAFIAEPIQGVGGFITPPKEYFKIVFKIVKKYGALFIADEVQTGWGRTGKRWFGIEQWEVVPDMITGA